MRFATRNTLARTSLAVVVLGLGAGVYFATRGGNRIEVAASAAAASSDATEAATADKQDKQSVNLTDQQLKSVKVEPVQEREFPIEKQAVGNIDFNQDLSVQVFTPYQGRIRELFKTIGDDVQKGDTLFTIDSPDLLQAESALIAASGVLQLTTRNLERLKGLYETRAVSQKDLEQAASDQQTAEGNLRAGRDSVRLFGKTDAEIDQIIARRMADARLVVPSPISGQVTARNAAPGLYVQPGSAPAPYTVSDINKMWMLANVIETDSPAFRIGQDVRVRVNAFPDREFEGRVTKIGAQVDSATRRLMVRSEINDPQHELRAGMFANFVISVGTPARSAAVPVDGVVREGDGTMTVWVTADRRRFTRRTVKVGQRRDGYAQILDGLQIGELIATEGALFLSNALAIASETEK